MFSLFVNDVSNFCWSHLHGCVCVCTSRSRQWVQHCLVFPEAPLISEHCCGATTSWSQANWSGSWLHWKTDALDTDLHNCSDAKTLKRGKASRNINKECLHQCKTASRDMDFLMIFTSAFLNTSTCTHQLFMNNKATLEAPLLEKKIKDRKIKGSNINAHRFYCTFSCYFCVHIYKYFIIKMLLQDIIQ